MGLRNSFYSAGAFPFKLLASAGRLIGEGLRPVHAFIYPSNNCNLTCGFCCCSREDRSAAPMSLDLYADIIRQVQPLAVTYGGGGEPTLNPDFESMIAWTRERFPRIKLGLMTNGTRLNRYSGAFWREFNWIRISMDPTRGAAPVLDHPGLSYVWIDAVGEGGGSQGETPGDAILQGLKSMEATGKIRNLRIEGDIHEATGYERGTKKCYMPMLRPVFAPDGAVYACCRAHYALKGVKGYLPEQLKVAKDAAHYMANYGVFDGSICDRCWYGDFNRLAGKIVEATGTEDLEFI